MVVKRVTLLAVATLALSLSSGYAAGRLSVEALAFAKKFQKSCENIYVNHSRPLKRIMDRADIRRSEEAPGLVVTEHMFAEFKRIAAIPEDFLRPASTYATMLDWLNNEARMIHERGKDMSEVMDEEIKALQENAWDAEEHKAVLDFIRLVTAIKYYAIARDSTLVDNR